MPAGETDRSNNDQLLRIDQVGIKNFRAFAEIDLTLHKQLTVIVAKNGCGKTAVLDALAVALGTFVGSFDSASGANFTTSDVRLATDAKAALKSFEPQYPLEVKAWGVIGGQGVEWRRELRSAKAHTTRRDAKPLSEYAERLESAVRNGAAGDATPATLPLVAYYGTGRLWASTRLTAARIAGAKSSRTDGYKDALNSFSHYKVFADWFERIHRAEFEQRQHPDKLDEITPLLKAVREAVNIVLDPTGWRDIAFRSAEGGVVATHSELGTLPVDWLSDGIRNMIGLAGDIAHRAVRLNPHLRGSAVVATSGVVLVDELDMHLHPAWQQTVVESLRQAFPAVQFVVTTHSPQLLSTVRRENIRVLKLGDKGQANAYTPEVNTFAEESATVLESVMDTPARPQLEAAKKLTEYQRMMACEDAESPAAPNLRHELEEIFGKDYVGIKLADMEYELRRAKSHPRS